jgi:predicted metal-dependent phosphotriesterase family hydrolase
MWHDDRGIVRFQTVTGLAPVEDVRLADAHGHVWIRPPQGVSDDSRLELCDYEPIEAELVDFQRAGATTVVDCQPGGCGRDAKILVRLARETGLHITATTGFHRQRYYPAADWLWLASEEEAAAYFVEELTCGMRETEGIVPATTIKVGYEGFLEDQTLILMVASAEAARQTGAIILCHTERGKNVEALLSFFCDRGVVADRLYICHMDKRPDLGLHRELAQAGVLLGYDTFLRPKYDPEEGAWPLLKKMIADDLADRIAIGLDLAEAAMWRHYGGQPGLLALPEQVVPRLSAEGISESIIARLTGQNIARYLMRRKSEGKELSE